MSQKEEKPKDPLEAIAQKKVKVSLKYAGLADAQVFHRGTLNGEDTATEFNQLVCLTNQAKEYTFEGNAEKIDALLAIYEADDSIVCKVQK